jgi:hypothetical protein
MYHSRDTARQTGDLVLDWFLAYRSVSQDKEIAATEERRY